MPLWGKIDQANNAPKYKIMPNSAAPGNTYFANTGPIAIVGLDDGEVQASSKAVAPGWNLIKHGTGPVTDVAIDDGGDSYANDEVVQISGGTSNSLYTITTDANGTITELTFVSGGAGFTNVDSLTVETLVEENGADSSGANAAFTVSLGGRAGRIQTEVLVALSGMTSNNSSID